MLAMRPFSSQRNGVQACLLGGMLACMVWSGAGCRAIRKMSDKGESIAARRMSREGIQAMHNGKWDKAESLFSDALQVSQSDDRAHRGLAETLWNRGEKDDAIAHMETAVRLSGNDPKLVQRLGRMYLETNRPREATQQCDIALAAERNSADIWALRGDCLSQSEKFEDALAAYHRALALQPDHPSAQLQAAEIYRHQGRYNRLLSTLDQIDLPPTLIPSRVDILRGIALSKLGQPDEASQHFLTAIEKTPDAAEPYLHLAQIELARENLSSAKKHVSAAMQLQPELVEQLGWHQLIDPHSLDTRTVSAKLGEDPHEKSPHTRLR